MSEYQSLLAEIREASHQLSRDEAIVPMRQFLKHLKQILKEKPCQTIN